MSDVNRPGYFSQPKPAKPRRISPFVITTLSALVVGLVLGLILGGFLPAVRPQPTPVSITVVPDGGDAGVAELVTPDVRGLPEKDARQALADHGITSDQVAITRVPHLSPEGYVVAQDPIGGTKNPDKVVLSLPEPAKVPDLAGRPEDDARAAVIAMGATPTIVRRHATGATAGHVIETNPRPGEPMAESIEIVVAATPQTTYLSKVRGSGGCSAQASSVNGVKFENSVTCSSYGTSPSETYWLLNRRTATLSATIGIEDHSDPGARARLVIDGDGRELFAGDLAYGSSRKIDVATVGVLRLTVKVQRVDEGRKSATVVLGDAVVSGSVEDLASLEQR